MRPTRWGDRGQSTVEFAMILPLVALVVLFIIQVGLIARDQLLLSHAAREAARAASVSDSDRSGAAMAAAKRAGSLTSERLSGVIESTDGARSVRVVLSYRSSTDLPIIGALIPEVELSSTVVMRTESDPEHGP